MRVRSEEELRQHDNFDPEAQKRCFSHYVLRKREKTNGPDDEEKKNAQHRVSLSM